MLSRGLLELVLRLHNWFYVFPILIRLEHLLRVGVVAAFGFDGLHFLVNNTFLLLECIQFLSVDVRLLYGLDLLVLLFQSFFLVVLLQGVKHEGV